MGYVVSSKNISIEAKKIEIVKNWPKSKSVCNISIFLSFDNFYWQFIQGFCKIAVLLSLMLEIIGSPDKPNFSRNNGSKSASSRNNNSKPTFRKNNGIDKINKFGISRNGMEYAKKLGNLFKLGKSKGEKASKF